VGRDFFVAGDGFWQVHPAAADSLAEAVREALVGVDLDGGSAWDLYGGVGLFTEVLAAAVGPSGSVVTVEGDRRASALAERNMAEHPEVSVVLGSVERVIGQLPAAVDAVVLDPPRAGAGPALCNEIAARNPSVIVYVACDPAALGRDTAALMAAGYRLDTVRAFDCFPQTHHVECVARFVPS
jgi:tRNA/tmRNA/rRNA uracil-C5-methylase (TrmA/RlmC/RlmD family)